MRNYRLAFGLLVVCLGSCKTTQTTTSASSVYKEDLSVLRPELGQETAQLAHQPEQSFDTNYIPPIAINSKLDTISKMIVERNQTVSYVDGYTIQIYSGNDRNEAYTCRERAIAMDTSFTPSVKYYQPNYKVKLGKYTNRLEAHKIFESIKPFFPRALMIPERIKVTYE